MWTFPIRLPPTDMTPRSHQPTLTTGPTASPMDLTGESHQPVIPLAGPANWSICHAGPSGWRADPTGLTARPHMRVQYTWRAGPSGWCQTGGSHRLPDNYSTGLHSLYVNVEFIAPDHHEMLQNDELSQRCIHWENTILSWYLSEESSYNATVTIKAK
jgi:hypothetical protein